MKKENIRSFFDNVADERLKWKKRNKYYHTLIEKYYKSYIPQGSTVLEIGCGTGELLSSLKPVKGVGIDFSEKTLKIASQKFPHLRFFKRMLKNLNLMKNSII